MNVVTAIRVFLVAMLLFAANGYAATLSDRTITSFISSLDELSAMEGEFAALTRDLDASADKGEELAMPDFEHVLSAALEDMQGHPAYNKLAEVVKRHGFSSAEQWTQAGDRIFHAWMALEMGTQGAEINQEIKNALAALDSNPDLSPAQKEQMKAMMGGAMAAMQQASSAPKADMNAVKP
ncbi:MAG: hypothetical protein WC913_11380, partial [Desulfuromonas sp.]